MPITPQVAMKQQLYINVEVKNLISLWCQVASLGPIVIIMCLMKS